MRKMILKFTHKRLREYPVSGGPSTLRVSVIRQDLEEYTKMIMDALSWHGVAMVEFLVSSRNNIPYFMEINPRYWGSLRLPIVSGIDFPYYHYLMARSENFNKMVRYKTGIKARWLLFGDILWLLTSKKENKYKQFFAKQKKKTYMI